MFEMNFLDVKVKALYCIETEEVSRRRKKDYCCKGIFQKYICDRNQISMIISSVLFFFGLVFVKCSFSVVCRKNKEEEILQLKLK